MRPTLTVTIIALALSASGCDAEVLLGKVRSYGGLPLDGGFDPGDGGSDCNKPLPNDDNDRDGWTPSQGDCNDCNKHINPNAIEVVNGEPGAEALDEDCDGAIDENDDVTCDEGIALDDLDPVKAAYAIDLCKLSEGRNDWGVAKARWTMPDGAPPPPGASETYHRGHGVLPDFGPNVPARRGDRLLVLSSGTARRPIDPGYESASGFDKGYVGGHPPGFPRTSPACPDVEVVEEGYPNDAVALELVVRTPSNAFGISFDFDFYTYEWPNAVCSEFNDFFLALLSTEPDGRPEFNMSFDAQGNPVSVNFAFFEVCGCSVNPPFPCPGSGKLFQCALGNSELVGTGFGGDTEGGDHGATSWQVTVAPVEPAAELTIRFTIYDSADGGLDSTTLVDNWRWIAEPGTAVSTVPAPR
jgi:hypothetical protein